MKTFKFILRRINCFLCDLALIYALFYLLLFVRPVGFQVSAYYFWTVILYFGLTYWLFRASFMQILFRIEIKKRHLNHFLFKIFCIAIIPLVLSVFYYDVFLILYVFILTLLSIIILPISKKSLWQLCSGSQVELQKDSYKKKSPIIISLFVLIALIVFPLFQSNFRLDIADFVQNNKNAAFPISMPEKACYLKNIRQYKEDPFNYVMKLFDNYDIVILSERMHHEYTQWEFFSEIILNDTFAAKVQNVFTEVGNTEIQEQLDSYMNTHFSTEEDLQRATAAIAREGAVWPLWNNTNIYDFILNLYRFNQSRDSANKINLFFTDYADWNKVNNPARWDSLYRSSARDSIMAYNVINQYENLTTKKCLLITNTRHAWKYGMNEASYIFKKYPEKTAVVWINCTAQLLYPAMNGTLDEAAHKIQDSIWAIDFKNCPLGNTHFDLFPSHILNNLTYKDFFAGMIYCKHPNDWILSENYPFILDNFKYTFLERSALVGEKYLEKRKESIEKGYYDKIDRRQYPLFALTNLLFIFIHSIILLFLFLNLFIKLLSLLFKKNIIDS